MGGADMHRKRREMTSMMRWHFCKDGDLGTSEWRHNDQWCSPIAESIIVDAWISLDEIFANIYGNKKTNKQ